MNTATKTSPRRRFRFTLGTMFIVMAMVAGAIALLIRYLASEESLATTTWSYRMAGISEFLWGMEAKSFLSGMVATSTTGASL